MQDSYGNGINNFGKNGNGRNSGQSKKELNLELINGMIGKLALSQQQNNLSNSLNGSAKAVPMNSEELSDR